MVLSLHTLAVVSRSSVVRATLVVLGIALASGEARADRTVGGNGGFNGGGFQQPNTHFRPGNYNSVMGNVIQHNPTTNSTYIPGVGVAKPSGIYRPMGNGYYQNPNTGKIYNPKSGLYTDNTNMHFRGGNYNSVMGNVIQHNPTTNSTYVPGVGVAKPSGVYRPIGNGYYQNPNTGNVYKPSSGAYFSR